MSNRYMNIEGHPGFVKDMETNTILNVNKETIAQKKAELRMMKKKTQNLNLLKMT